MKRATLMLYTIAAPVLVVLALPFAWMLLTSFKTMEEIVQMPATLWPEALRLDNYRIAWQAAPFGRFYANSFVTGISATVLQVGIALFMAYAFALIRFPAKHAFLLAVLATMMIPDEIKLVPNYLLMARLGWVDTYWALIIPPAAHAFPVFVLYQQFRTMPRALIDAARVDGAGHLRILLQVVTPMSRPVLAAVTLVAFLGRWNDYLWPLIATNRLVMRTLPIGLAYLQEVEEGAARWNILMAGTIFVIMPLLIGYALTQRQFVDGITRGALKG
jgi:sn-glycerol 3-phosphate transport system permease protein